MIGALIVAVLACGALAFVAAPLRSGASPVEESSAAAAELESRKRAALTAIIDIENERDIGKLSGDDFAILRSEYETEAVAALLELDALHAGEGEVDVELEAEIAAVKERLSSGGSALIACPSCGAPRVPGRACRRCGA